MGSITLQHTYIYNGLSTSSNLFEMCHFLEITFACLHSKRTEAITKCSRPLRCLWSETFWAAPSNVVGITKLPDYLFRPYFLEGVFCQTCCADRAAKDTDRELELRTLQREVEEIRDNTDRRSRNSEGTSPESSGIISVCYSPVEEMKQTVERLPRSHTPHSRPTIRLTPPPENGYKHFVRRPAFRRKKSILRPLPIQQPVSFFNDDSDDEDSLDSVNEEVRHSAGSDSSVEMLPMLQARSYRAPPRICASGSCRNPVAVIENKQGNFCPNHTCAARDWGCLNNDYSPKHGMRKQRFCMAHTCSAPGCLEKVATPAGVTCPMHRWLNSSGRFSQETYSRDSGYLRRY